MEFFHAINNFIVYFLFCLSLVSPHENASFIRGGILFVMSPVVTLASRTGALHRVDQ